MIKDISPDQLYTRLQTWFMRRNNLSAIRRISDLPISIGTDIGLVRTENQDRVAILRVQVNKQHNFVVSILCDGMGGMEDGALCASAAVSAFFTSCILHSDLKIADRAINAVNYANYRVHSLYKGRGGATLSAVIIDNIHGIIGVNIGDSRIYSYNKGSLQQLTKDDTIAGQVQNIEHYEGLRRNEILQFIGIGDGLEPHLVNFASDSDFFILTSDGVHYMEQNTIQLILQNATEPAIGVRRLLELSKWCGGADNGSIVIGKIVLSSSWNDETDTIQCWDSFGEIQVAVVPKLPETAKHAIAAPANYIYKNLLESSLKKEAKKANKNNQKPKQSNKKKTKSDLPKITEPRPQLKIDFINEANEKKHS